jgi:hypothetical protein
MQPQTAPEFHERWRQARARMGIPQGQIYTPRPPSRWRGLPNKNQAPILQTTAGEYRKVRIRSIILIVANDFNVTADQIVGPRRTDNIVLPRQVAMWLSRALTGASLLGLGSAFNRDHTTVIYGSRKVEELMEKDPIFRVRVERLAELCRLKPVLLAYWGA